MMQPPTTDERFNRIDAQLQEMRKDFNDQFDKLASVVVKGFDQINSALDAKADKSDMQRIYDYLDKIVKLSLYSVTPVS